MSIARTLLLALMLLPAHPLQAAEGAPPAHPLDRFVALAGQWSAEGLDDNSAPGVQVIFEVTAGGSAVVETLFPGSPHEMRTVYYKDGEGLALTHYCASGHHPKMRAASITDRSVSFAFDGATNFDPATDTHMHEAEIEFVGADELRARWLSWSDGKPAEHAARFHLRRIATAD